ncbi:DMT family transporter [Methanohalobium sp.]|uniref:DMT family transporter n=1 Tax=Methanohalobium sp. TaxID=2837493 RepID=UPI0025E91C99|nr:DMT family transporter [Methanohalobium sp.]
MVDTEQMRIKEHENRIRSGYMWALFCAVLWGLWYIPGTVVWTIEPFTGMLEEVSGMISGDGPLVIVAALVTAFNALTVIIALMVWNGTLLRLPELGRTLREFKPCSKWFLIGSVCGGPIAIFGSFMAMAFIGGAFAAVAGLLYPGVGSITANLWYGEKITKRAAVGILVIIAGGVTIFGGGLINDIQSAEGVAWLGYLGGAMAALGWGLEGAIAGVGLEVSESDTGLTARFVFELLLWWIIIIPALAIAGFPMYEYAIQVFQPIPLLVMVFAGITFGFCYVSWYKSFPLIGVGRGQGVANLYGLMSIIFLFLFLGSTPAWTVFVGGLLCIAGAFIMFTEESLEIETLRG